MSSRRKVGNCVGTGNLTGLTGKTRTWPGLNSSVSLPHQVSSSSVRYSSIRYPSVRYPSVPSSSTIVCCPFAGILLFQGEGKAMPFCLLVQVPLSLVLPILLLSKSLGKGEPQFSPVASLHPNSGTLSSFWWHLAPIHRALVLISLLWLHREAESIPCFVLQEPATAPCTAVQQIVQSSQFAQCQRQHLLPRQTVLNQGLLAVLWNVPVSCSDKLAEFVLIQQSKKAHNVGFRHLVE